MFHYTIKRNYKYMYDCAPYVLRFYLKTNKRQQQQNNTKVFFMTLT